MPTHETGQRTMPYADAIAALEKLYAELPSFTCQRKCQQSCGVIVMTRLEWVRITRKLGYKPKGKHSCVCPMLKQGGCSVHAIRPTVCRLYGLLDMPLMRCPWGCTPERWLTEQEGYAWLAMAETVSQQIYPHAAPAAQAQGIPIEGVAAYIDRAKAAGKVYLPCHPTPASLTTTPPPGP